MQKLCFLILFATMALSCNGGNVVVPDTEACTVAGVIAAGAICAHTLTHETRDMTMEEYFDMLEPKDEIPAQGETPAVPARAGAVCQTTSDWNAQKTTLEQACRVLGKNCTYEMKQVIKGMNQVSEMAAQQVEEMRFQKQMRLQKEVKQ